MCDSSVDFCYVIYCATGTSFCSAHRRSTQD